MSPYQGVFTSSQFSSYQTGLIHTLLQTAFNSSSNFEIFHQEIIKLKDTFTEGVILLVSLMFVSKSFWIPPFSCEKIAANKVKHDKVDSK